MLVVVQGHKMVNGFLQAVNVKATGIIQQLFNQSTEKIEAT